MNKDLMFRFFEGTTTLEEEKLVQTFIEFSEENRNSFMKERIEYDVMLMNANETVPVAKKIVRFSPWIWRAAVVVGFLLTFSMLYLWKNSNELEKYTTLIVPAGQRINLVLEDSTKVWLNANTTFKYPNGFAKSKRIVYLDGEGYFEVSKNKDRPFTVKTQKGDILVTGTKFNVEAYPRDSVFETSLFEGGVELYKDDAKVAVLKPNQKSLLVNGKLSIVEIDGNESYLWRKGLIAFKNKKLEEILPEFAQSFNVKIKVLAKKLPQEIYTGKFRQEEGIEYALQVLKQSMHFSYQRDFETGIIYIK